MQQRLPLSLEMTYQEPSALQLMKRAIAHGNCLSRNISFEQTDVVSHSFQAIQTTQNKKSLSITPYRTHRYPVEVVNRWCILIHRPSDAANIPDRGRYTQIIRHDEAPCSRRAVKQVMDDILTGSMPIVRRHVPKRQRGREAYQAGNTSDCKFVTGALDRISRASNCYVRMGTRRSRSLTALSLRHALRFETA